MDACHTAESDDHTALAKNQLYHLVFESESTSLKWPENCG